MPFVRFLSGTGASMSSELRCTQITTSHSTISETRFRKHCFKRLGLWSTCKALQITPTVSPAKCSCWAVCDDSSLVFALIERLAGAGTDTHYIT